MLLTKYFYWIAVICQKALRDASHSAYAPTAPGQADPAPTGKTAAGFNVTEIFL
jgi:hypothetical protein